MTDSAYDLANGTLLDERYRIVRELGRGGMSSVYLAEHALIGRRVAVKVLHHEVARSAESVARFMAEARTVGTLGHPNVVASTDMGHLPDGRPYLILEYLEGWTLAEELESIGRLPFQRAAHIALQIASGVGAAHDRGIVHRDLKSDNIFLAQTEHAVDHVKILDFGISKFLESPLETGQTQRGIILGTPEFMAPEQIHSPEQVDHRADIYALGTILYHMLLGQTPFENTPAPKLWNRILHEAPRPVAISDVPGPLAELIQRVLAKDPADRPQSMLALFDELAPFGYPPGADRRVTPMPARAPTFLRPRLVLEAGRHPTPLPAPMTITQAEHSGDSRPNLLGRNDLDAADDDDASGPAGADTRPRLDPPARALAAAQAWAPHPPRPGSTPRGAPMPHLAQRPLRDSRPMPRRATQPRSGRRKLWLPALMLLLLAAGAGAGLWLVPVLSGSQAAAPAATDGAADPAASDTPPAMAPVVVVGQGEAPGTASGAASGNPARDTPGDPLDENAPGMPDEDGAAGAGDEPVVAAAGDQDGPEADDAAGDPLDRRRRRRDRRRDASDARKEPAGADTSARTGEQGRTPAEPLAATTPAVAENVTSRDTTRAAPGRVDPEATRRTVRAHLAEIRTCHERGRMDEPGLAGRVVVRIGIGRGGRVTSAAIASSTLGAPSVEKCITSAVQKWTFPEPTGSGTAVIEYPFVLK